MKLTGPYGPVVYVSCAKLVVDKRAVKAELPKHQEEGVGAAGHRVVVGERRPWEEEEVVVHR